MKDDFNFEQTLGLLAQALENKKYNAAFDQLDVLALHAEQKDVIPAMSGAIDYLADKTTNPMQLLDCLEEMLETLKNPASEAEKSLQTTIVQKWAETLERFTSMSPDNALQYLTWVNRDIAADNPVGALALSAWETLVESCSIDTYSKQNALTISNEIKSPDFRLAVLTKIAAHQSENPDETLEALDAAMTGMVFYDFSKTDTASANLFLQTMTNILKDRADQYDAKKTIAIGWSILVRGEGFNDAGAKTTARVYLDAASKLEAANPHGAFNAYHGLVERKNPLISAEAGEAANRILDLAGAGKLDNYKSGFDYVMDKILEKIFLPAVEEGKKGEALADRAADMLLPVICDGILNGDNWSKLRAYNNALTVLKALPAGNPRAAEIVPLLKDGLKRDCKEEDIKTYVRMTGWLLDVAAGKDDAALVRYAQTEWKAGVEVMAAKNPREAYDAIQDDIKYAGESSARRALAATVLPALEARAGIKKEPVAIDPAKFLQRYSGKKNGPAR